MDLAKETGAPTISPKKKKHNYIKFLTEWTIKNKYLLAIHINTYNKLKNSKYSI